MTVRNELWTVKYKPTSLDQVALSESNKIFLEKCLEDGEIPHLLLIGPPGIGKTATAHVLIEGLDCRHITLNASNERGIDVIRDKVGTFARSSMGTRWNIVFLDEADGLTADAQNSLRNLMEQYSAQTRFILTANYEHKIIAPLKSRCTEIKLADLTPKERGLVLVRILKEEGVPIEKETLVSYAKEYTDLRKMVSRAQRDVQLHGKLTRPSVVDIDGDDLWVMVTKKDWDRVVKLAKDENTHHIGVLKALFWAVPNEQTYSATVRAIIADKIDTSVFAPDAVVHMLGCFAHVMKEV